MGVINISKASYIVSEVLDERGRYISPSEFKWIMNYFKDRYDPRRLAFAIMYCCGLRHEDGVRARVKWFTPDFKIMKMSQCKAHVRQRDGVVKIKSKPRFVPLPEWLSEDLRYFITYRTMVGLYVGEDLSDMRMFPKLKKGQLRDLFCKIRKKLGDKEKWLNDEPGPIDEEPEEAPPN